MISFVHDQAAGRVLFGSGSRRRIPDEVDRLGASRVVLVCAASQRGPAGEVAAALGARLAARLPGGSAHVPAAEVASAVAAVGECAADLLLSFGGGSATGLAKAVALRTGLPILAVATTYAGSEVSPIWGITEHGRKSTGRDRAVLPAVVVYDPELTVSLPAAVSAASGMNALAHLVEGLYASDASPPTLLLAEEGVRTLAAALPRVVAAPAELAARADALYGAWLAGSVLGLATMGLHHRACHVLGGRYGLPHAGTHAALLPYVTAHNAGHAGPAMARLRRVLGGDPALLLHQLARRIGAPTSLAQVGFAASSVDEAAALIAAAPAVTNPGPVDEPSLRALLLVAHAGRPPGSPAPE